MVQDALTQALADFQRQPVRSPRRTAALQLLLAQALADRGHPARIECPVAGAYRSHNWDVASIGTPRYAISVRSIVTSWAKNLHNRLDEMLAEAVNLRRADPQAKIGYLGLIVGSSPECLRVLTRFTAGVAARCGGHPEQFTAGAVLHLDAPADRLHDSFTTFLDELCCLPKS